MLILQLFAPLKRPWHIPLQIVLPLPFVLWGAIAIAVAIAIPYECLSINHWFLTIKHPGVWLVIFGFAGLIATTITLWIAHSIVKLSHAATAIAAGKIDTPIPQIPITELNQVAQSLAAIQQQMQQSLELTQQVVYKSEVRFRRLFNQASISFVEFRLFADTTLEYDYYSKSCESVFGYTADEMISGIWSTRVHPEDYAVITEQMQQLKQGQSIEIEYRFHTRQGNWRWVSGRLSSRRDDANDCWIVVGIDLDISDRKQTELALQESAATLHKLSEQVPGTIYQYRLYPDGSACFPYASAGIHQVYAVTPEQIKHDALIVLDRLHPDDLEPILETIQTSAQSLQLWSAQYRVNLPQKGLRWLEGRAQPQRLADGGTLWHGCIWDITEQKLAEIALQELNRELEQRVEERTREILATQASLHQSETLFRQLFEDSPVGIALGDSTTYQMYRTNRAFQTMLGYTGAELAELTFSQITHPDDLAIETRKLDSVLEGQSQSYHCEKRYIRKDGSICWASLTAAPIRNQQGEILCGLGIVEDISDRKRAEIALRQSEERFATAFRANPIASAIVSYPDGTVLDVNESYLNLLGYTRQQVIGRNTLALNLWHPPEIRDHVMRSLQVQPSLRNLEIRFNTSTGQILYGVIFLERITLQGQPCLLKMIYDITERKQIEMTLQRKSGQEQMLRMITQRIRQSLNLEEILSVTVTEVQQTLGADRALILQINSSNESTIIQAATTAQYPVVEKMRWVDQCFSAEHTMHYQWGIPRVVQNVAQDRWVPCLQEFMQEIQVKSKMVAPIVQNNGAETTLWGLLIVHACSHPRIWHDGEAESLQQIANQVAIAIQQANLYHQVQTELGERKQAESSLRQSLEEKDILLKEVHHRVKNNLQIVSSLLRLQSRQVKNASTATLFQEATNRVQSMALIHEQLYQSHDLSQIDFGDYLQTLVNNLFHSCGVSSQQIALVIDTGDHNLTLNYAIPCGLIVNELITNSLKYAFPDHRQGEVKIYLKQEFASDPTLPSQGILCVADNGVGIPESLDWQNTSSLGLRIVRNLTTQLGGNLILDRHNGTRFQIIFPIHASCASSLNF